VKFAQTCTTSPFPFRFGAAIIFAVEEQSRRLEGLGGWLTKRFIASIAPENSPMSSVKSMS
jgi:hypothetical protein